MAKYLALYRADQNVAEQLANLTPEQQQAGMDNWIAWFGQAGPAILDGGAPVVGPGDVSGYSILEAPDRDAVDALLAERPHRQVGDIDVYEFLPMPGM